MKRHNYLSFKKPENLGKDAWYPYYVIQIFYKKLSTIVVNNNIKKSFVFNADESGFKTDPSRLNAIGERGKTMSRISGGSEMS